MRYYRTLTSRSLAIMAGLLPTAAAAQEAEPIGGQLPEIILILADNVLVVVAVFLAVVLLLGKSLDLFRSLRDRRMAANEKLAATKDLE